MNTPHDDYTNCLEHDAVAASGAHFDMQRVQLSIAMSLTRIADSLEKPKVDIKLSEYKPESLKGLLTMADTSGMTEDQISQIFAFISAAEGYLANMADRGDDAAKGLHTMAFDILAEHGEADHLDVPDND